MYYFLHFLFLTLSFFLCLKNKAIRTKPIAEIRFKAQLAISLNEVMKYKFSHANSCHPYRYQFYKLTSFLSTKFFLCSNSKIQPILTFPTQVGEVQVASFSSDDDPAIKTVPGMQTLSRWFFIANS